MNEKLSVDADAAARRARFGRLPGRIRPEDMAAEVETAPAGAGGAAHNPENSWKFYSCLALDLGL
ncbi:hypothetical protein [Streptomyces sp. NPDC093094]|uniref:hypothetical protein n=1 Tax=Streptomyces sp. NPDC093094 TaxID=3366026 RepID=UPI00381635F2